MEEHKLSEPQTFVKAGKALFTVENSMTGNRFTFKVKRCDEPGKELYFVSVLSGPDNESAYRYIGAIFGSEFRRTKRSRVSQEAPSFKAFAWFNRNLANLPDFVNVYHHSHCGRCGRLLTVPESIEAGLGPECIKMAA